MRLYPARRPFGKTRVAGSLPRDAVCQALDPRVPFALLFVGDALYAAGRAAVGSTWRSTGVSRY